MGNNASKSQKKRTSFFRLPTDHGKGDELVIPYIKQKKIGDEVRSIVHGSVWMANYKRAFRGLLRKHPNKSQPRAMERIHDRCTTYADQLGLKGDTLAALIDTLVDEVGVMWYSDALTSLRARKILTDAHDEAKENKKVRAAIGRVFRQMALDHVLAVGKRLYDKYSRGADAEESDVELDEERKKRISTECQEAIRRAAEERERQAMEWQREAEMEGKIHEARVRDLENFLKEQKKNEEAHPLL